MTYALVYQPAVEHFTLPLAPLALAAVSPVPTRVQDGRFDPHVPVERPAVVGLSVLSGRPIADALRFSAAVRARHPGVPIVWGGWHASILPEATAKHALVDVAVVGQGQQTWAEIVQRCAERGPTDRVAFGDIAGTVTKDGRAPERPFVTPATFPLARYDLVDVERYYAAKGRRGLDYVSSQGCPFRCAFCSDPLVYGRSWHALPAERVLAEVDELVTRYRADEVSFQDDLFFVNRTRALAIADGLARRARRLQWVATARAQHLVAMREDELDLLARSGLRRVTVGAESGSDDTLARLNKDQRADMLLGAAERLGKRGISASFSFIAGTPGEPPAELERTLDRILAIKRLNPRTDTPLFRFTPYPGSDLVADLERRGVPLPQTLEAWSECDFYASRVADLTPEQSALVERFAFYAHFGWAPDGSRARRAYARVARARLERRVFTAPIEMWLVQRWRGRRTR